MIFSENPPQTNTKDDNIKCLCKWPLSPGRDVQDILLKLVGTSDEMEARLDYESAEHKKRERAANSSDYGSGSSPSSNMNTGFSNKNPFLNVCCLSKTTYILL